MSQVSIKVVINVYRMQNGMYIEQKSYARQLKSYANTPERNINPTYAKYDFAVCAYANPHYSRMIIR